MRYLLVGCSLISELPEPKHYPFSEEELKDWRNTGKKVNGGALKMKNFPTMNWAIQFTHDPESAVLLPYKEYIKHADEHPEDEEKLDEMKVVIEEESLVRGFKYVAMDIDNVAFDGLLEAVERRCDRGTGCRSYNLCMKGKGGGVFLMVFEVINSY